MAYGRLSPLGVAVEQLLLAALPDGRLAFNKPWAKFNGAGAANILPHAGGKVFGTINRMLPAGLDVLDDYEGVATGDRKSVAEGKSVSVRVDIGGRRIIKKKIQK